MPISNVSLNFSPKFNGFNGKVDSKISGVQNAIESNGSEANYLLDSSYGRSLVKNNKI